VPRSYRDRKEMAIEGAEYLKSRNPTSEVTVRDYEGQGAADRYQATAAAGEAVTRIAFRKNPAGVGCAGGASRSCRVRLGL
jgi:hypothetical protein